MISFCVKSLTKNADKMKIIIKVDLRKQIETYRNILIGIGEYNVVVNAFN